MSEPGSELARIFEREVARVERDVAAYRDERNLWVTLGAQRNAPGTLALHLAGNLLHYVGAELGATGYVRDRHAEFHDRDVPRDQILERLAEARGTVVRVLERLPADALDTPYPGEIPDVYGRVSTRGWLAHLLWHLGWHAGQVYYHRLSVEGPEQSPTVDAS